jgi:hypothetical protein
VQILSYFKAFGEQGYSANVTDKRKAALAKGRAKKGERGYTYFVGRPGGGRLPLGVWQRISFGSLGSAIKPVILFVTQPRYRQHLDVPGIAQRVIADRFADELSKAVAQTQRTARPGPMKTLL